MATLKPINLIYPGSYGLNTQENTLVNPETRYGATVTNCVVDSTGALVSRKNFALQTGSFSNTLQAMFVWKQTDGTEVIMSAGAGHLYSGTSTLTSRADYSATSTASNSWQFATLGSNLVFVQEGLTAGIIDEDWTSAAFSGNIFAKPNVVMSAFGRMWFADDTSINIRDTIWWCNLLDAEAHASGDAGSLDLTNAWPEGRDRIVALSNTGNRLIVHGRKWLLMYTIPDGNNPASMALAAEDVVQLGTVARDSVQVTPEGVFFLSDNGIFKIDRFAQTTALMTHKHVSVLFNDQVLASIAAENAKLIRSAYYKTEGFYVLSFPTQNKSYCIHTRKPVPDVEGAYVATTWTNTGRPFTSFAVDGSDNFYMGGVNGVHLFTGYTPDSTSNAYSVIFSPQWLDFGDISRVKHGKKVTMVLNAASGQTGTLTWSEDYISGTTRSESFTCDATEFAEDPGLGTARVPLGGSFTSIQPTITMAVNGDKIAIHHMQLLATPGAVKP